MAKHLPVGVAVPTHPSSAAHRSSASRRLNRRHPPPFPFFALKLHRGDRLGRGSSTAPARGLLDGLFGGGPLDLPDVDPDFTLWLAKRGLPSQAQLVLQDCGRAGRGLVATTNIRKGEPLLQVPEELLLTADAALEGSAIGDEMKEAGFPEWTVLATFLVEARHQSGLDPEEDGPWSGYIRRLPKAAGGILDWEEDEARTLLAGTSAAMAAEEIYRSAKSSWEEAEPVVRSAEERGLLPRGVVTEAAMRWAFGVLLSRLIRLPGKGNKEALIPWADFLNHSPSTSSHIDWDVASYGERSSAELLLSYGFLPEEGSNPDDAVLLEVGLDSADKMAELKAEVLARYGLGPLETFPLRLNGIPAALVPYQAIASHEGELTAEEMAALAASLFNAPETQPAIVRQATSIILQRLKRRLSELESAGKSGGSVRRKGPRQPTGAVADEDRRLRAEQAAALRKIEHRIVSRCEFVLRDQQRLLARLG